MRGDELRDGRGGKGQRDKTKTRQGLEWRLTLRIMTGDQSRLGEGHDPLNQRNKKCKIRAVFSNNNHNFRIDHKTKKIYSEANGTKGAWSMTTFIYPRIFKLKIENKHSSSRKLLRTCLLSAISRRRKTYGEETFFQSTNRTSSRRPHEWIHKRSSSSFCC